MKPELILLPEVLAVCRLGPDAPIPGWALAGPLFSVTRTAQELSIVCPEALLPPDGMGIRVERGFRAFQVVGPLDFALTGLLSALLAPLARAVVPVFVLSTFDTDLILVRREHTKRAAEALTEAAVVRQASGSPQQGEHQRGGG